jgi:CheY-like chemotaxis protein
MQIRESINADADLHQVKVLLVEDNKINSMIASKIMKEWGIELDEAVNGKIGIELLKKNNYDIVLMDIQMPEMDGYEATKYIRTKMPEPLNAIPVLAMTAHASHTEKGKCIKCGMNDIISKPFIPADLKKKITLLLRNGTQKQFYNKNIVNTKDNNGIINLDLLRMISGENNEFLKEFIGIFLSSTPRSVALLQEYIKKGDWENIRQTAHKLKPTFTYIGLKELGAASCRIEELAKSKSGLVEIAKLADEMDKSCKKAVLQLENELQEL